MNEATLQRRVPPVLVAGLAFAAAYFAWQLWGLRYTTHDDIYFHLHSWVFAGAKTSLATDVATAQGRVQAYINMPIILPGVDGLSESGLYDVLNIGHIVLAVYGSLIYFLTTIGPLRDAIALTTVALLLFFPCTTTFHFPKGSRSWPAGDSVSHCWLQVSSGASLREPPRKMAASVALFVCSLWGPEYNFVLHPILLGVPLLNGDVQQRRRLHRTVLPYFFGWLTCVIPYLVYSTISHGSGADADGRVVPGIDVVAWIKTIGILEEKAFLPVSLVQGIVLRAATQQGAPEIPSILTFRSLVAGIPDLGSFFVVSLVAWAMCGVSLQRQQLSAKAILNYALVFLSIAFIPCAVLAASSHYQKIVLAGYLQGHLATYYAQLGMAGIVFLLLSLLCNYWSTGLQRTIVVCICRTGSGWTGRTDVCLQQRESAGHECQYAKVGGNARVRHFCPLRASRSRTPGLLCASVLDILRSERNLQGQSCQWRKLLDRVFNISPQESIGIQECRL